MTTVTSAPVDDVTRSDASHAVESEVAVSAADASRSIGDAS